LRKVLTALGCDLDLGSVPAGMKIVQVGDLVRMRRGFVAGSVEVGIGLGPPDRR
jgi:hypothetical protein